MTTNRHADKEDGPAKENDLDRGQVQPASAPDARANADQAAGQPNGSRVPAQIPAQSSDQASSHEVPPRDILNLIWRTATDEKAQQGVDSLLRSFSRHILLPICCLALLTVIPVLLIETMPSNSLAMKIGTWSVTAVGIAAGILFKWSSKKGRSKKGRSKITNGDSSETRSGRPGGNGSAP